MNSPLMLLYKLKFFFHAFIMTEFNISAEQSLACILKQVFTQKGQFTSALLNGKTKTYHFAKRKASSGLVSYTS